VAVVVACGLVTSGCVGSGKVAHSAELGPLPRGVRIVTDVTTPCRDGEAGFEYRYVVLAGTSDLSSDSPLLRQLRSNGFYHSVGLPDDLPWITVGYQNEHYPLRAELGSLGRYLDHPGAHEGPDSDAVPPEVRAHPDDAVLVALRPTDFGCSTPL
jgi:hypothetical protein